MAHNHAHHHPVSLTTVNRAFVAGIALNMAFVIVEVIVGLNIHSLSLLSDAGHNLADVGSLALSLLAFRLMKVQSNARYTYGYRKTTILTALFNGVVLLVSIGAISIEAARRLFHPEALPGKTIAVVAAVGIVINGFTAFFFMKEQHKDLNIKGAYLHLMADAAVSAALVVGGIVMLYTGWYWLDAVLSLGVALAIVVSTWQLLKDSLRLSLDGVPKEIDLQAVKDAALKISGVASIYHVHVWAMSTAENAMTAHLVLQQHISAEQEETIKRELRHEMEHLNIQHVTLETERKNQALGCVHIST